MRRRDGDPMMVRVLGSICAVATIIGLAGGLSSGFVQPGRPLAILGALGAYFVVASIGTILLRKVFAVLLGGPLAALGVAAIVIGIVQGPWVAAVMDCLVVAPLLSLPAFVVYRNWRCLS